MGKGQKPNKGVIKRFKVTANGKVKWKRSGTGHLMSHKGGRQCQKLRSKQMATTGDVKRLAKQINVRLIPGDRVIEREPVAQQA